MVKSSSIRVFLG